jgi:hypothetical protein
MCEQDLCKKCEIKPAKKGELQICEQCWFHCNYFNKDMSLYKRDFTTICPICKNTFKKNIWNQIFCSKQCKNYQDNHIMNAHEFICKICSKHFMTNPNKSKKGYNKCFCSPHCNSIALGKQTSAAMRTNERYGNYYCKAEIDGKQYKFRSGWELKTAIYFQNLGIKWEFEKHTFECGPLGLYIPDFYIPLWDKYIEVKGERFKSGLDKFEYCDTQDPSKFLLWGKKELQSRGILTCKIKPNYVKNTSPKKDSPSLIHSHNFAVSMEPLLQTTTSLNTMPM